VKLSRFKECREKGIDYGGKGKPSGATTPRRTASGWGANPELSTRVRALKKVMGDEDRELRPARHTPCVARI